MTCLSATQDVLCVIGRGSAWSAVGDSWFGRSLWLAGYIHHHHFVTHVPHPGNHHSACTALNCQQTANLTALTIVCVAARLTSRYMLLISVLFVVTARKARFPFHSEGAALHFGCGLPFWRSLFARVFLISIEAWHINSEIFTHALKGDCGTALDGLDWSAEGGCYRQVYR